MLHAIRLALPTVVSAIALAFAWWQWKIRELRREDVLAWANKAIESLQTIWLVATLDGTGGTNTKSADMLASEAVRASVLVEQGRMFFKNQVTDLFGSDKPPAYRGYRPLILDPLVLGHQVASHWPAASIQERELMKELALTATRTFVSLVQKEVGRGKTASMVTRRGGRGIVLAELLNDRTVNPWTIEELDRPSRVPIRLRARAALHRTTRWFPKPRG